MRKCKYELKRLPNINGEMNWSLEQCEPLIYRMVSWDYDKINEYVSNMEIGETRILEA